MLILFHGEMVLILPAAFCLLAAALLFAYVWGSRDEARGSLAQAAAVFSGLIFGIFGLFMLAGFLDEFVYVVKYTF